MYLKKIRNIHLWFITLCAAMLYLISGAQGQLNIDIFLLLNPMIGFIIGFLLYLTGIFKGGDAKLFFTYSLLLPVNRHTNILPFSCIVLFINTFLIAFLFLLPSLFTDIIVKKERIIKEVLSRETILNFCKIFLITFGISWIMEPILSFFIFKNNIFLNFLILYFGYLFFYNLINAIKIKWLFFFMLIVGGILRYIFIPESFLFEKILNFFKRILLFSTLFYVLRKIIDSLEEKQQRIPFAPFMFFGAILTNTNFLNTIIKLLGYLK